MSEPPWRPEPAPRAGVLVPEAVDRKEHCALRLGGLVHPAHYQNGGRVCPGVGVNGGPSDPEPIEGCRR